MCDEVTIFQYGNMKSRLTLRSSDGAVCREGGSAGIFTPQVCHKSIATYLDGKLTRGSM